MIGCSETAAARTTGRTPPNSEIAQKAESQNSSRARHVIEMGLAELDFFCHLGLNSSNLWANVLKIYESPSTAMTNNISKRKDVCILQIILERFPTVALNRY